MGKGALFFKVTGSNPSDYAVYKIINSISGRRIYISEGETWDRGNRWNRPGRNNRWPLTWYYPDPRSQKIEYLNDFDILD
ncbi:MAG: hypothetical protein WC119_00475 [Synergistaceae bacterium]